LFQALSEKHPVLPIFIFDKEILDPLTDKNDKRVSFIYSYLKKLNAQLKDTGSSLLCLHDSPLNAFKKLCSEFKIVKVFTNHDYEPYAIKRDAQIGSYLQNQQIEFHSYKDQVIFEKSEIVKSDQTPYLIFTPYSKMWKQKFRAVKNLSFPSERRRENFIKNSRLHFPTLNEIGFNENDFEMPEAKIDKSIIKHYEKTRNIPSINGTTRLSVHLRFGTISIRHLASIADDLNEQFLNELIWREFFMMILYHFPDVVTKSFKEKYDRIQWRNNEAEFQAWCKGETGYPIVDAGMRQMNETGFMHNRVRMIVASFLTKHLLIDWRWGEAYFAEKLLDYELSSNNGNWQWAAGCGCDAAPYFRIFNPSEQTKKFDPDHLYIKKWLGDLSDYFIPSLVDHDFARKRALMVYKKALAE
jgi:deoxyribodipyrimidine photo-lyase